jgi:hypothetical protein
MKPLYTTLLFLLVSSLVYSQTNPPPPAPPSTTNSSQDFGNTQNGIMGAQSRSFGGGSIIKPNQILNSADFALIGSPTYETFSFRPGTSLCWGKMRYGKGFGVNAVLTFDLSQQAYSFYYRNNNWFYHVNFGRLGIALNTGASVTRVWNSKKYKDLMFGTQLGVAVVANGDKSNTDAYFVMVPYSSLILQKKFEITKNIDWSPQAYITVCSPYYDIGENFTSSSNTFNMVVGNSLTFNISKHFKLSLAHRANINTTPKFGIMHNILIGSSLKF